MNIRHTPGRPVKVICTGDCKRHKVVIARQLLPNLKCRHCGGILREKRA